MLGNDIVGFQTREHARSLLYTCEAYVPDQGRLFNPVGAIWHDRRIEVRTYPISIDADRGAPNGLLERSRVHDRYLPTFGTNSPCSASIAPNRAKTSCEVFWRSIGFWKPTRTSRVASTSSRSLVPSRMDVVEYQDYLDDVSAIVGRINAKYANVETGWQPIHLIMGENYPRALAAMKWYDVLMVNTIIDGMNLVAKEGALSTSATAC